MGHEIAQLAHEDDPLNVVRALEKEDWLKVLHPHWPRPRWTRTALAQLMKTRQQMVDLGYTVDPSAAVMHFLTARLSDKDISDLRRQIPRKDLVEAWRDIEDHAKELAKRLTGKEAATPSRTWNLALVGAPGDGSVSGGDGAASDGGAEDQELPDQVAAGAAAHSAARDDRVADHSAVAGISEDCARRLHAAAGRKAALADRDSEIPEALCAAASATASATQARARSLRLRQCSGGSGAGKRRSGEGQRERRAAAVAAPPHSAGAVRRRPKKAKTGDRETEAKPKRRLRAKDKSGKPTQHPAKAATKHQAKLAKASAKTKKTRKRKSRAESDRCAGQV